MQGLLVGEFRGQKEDGPGILGEGLYSKKFGGLNIKSCSEWNIALVGKFLCQLADKQDRSVVGQIGHEIYMKANGKI